MKPRSKEGSVLIGQVCRVLEMRPQMSEPSSLYDRYLDMPEPPQISLRDSTRSGIRARERRYLKLQLFAMAVMAAALGWIAWSMAVERWRQDCYARMMEHSSAELFYGSYPEPEGPAFARYHAELKQKYLRAAERPWLSVPPDPPPPQD